MNNKLFLILLASISILFVLNNKTCMEYFEDIYDYKVSIVFKKMFEQPSIWLGYQDFDPDYQAEKLYVKNSVLEEKNI